MRMIFLSDRMYGSPSAYSKHTFEVCTRLAKLGHKMAHIPMGYANFMGKSVFRDVLVYNSDRDDAFGENVAVPDYIEFKADMLITNKEPWVFQQLHKWAINFVPMAIIDHSPVSYQIINRLETAFKIIAISRFGQRELTKNNIKSDYIPLGVRTDIFQPLDKNACKKAFFLEPEDFIVGVVAMNRARKMIPQMLRGYRRFIELNPDIKTKMMLWTNVLPARNADQMQGVGVADVGVHLLPEINNLELNKAVNWIKWDDVERIGGLPEFDPQGVQDMCRLYNSFDVLLGATGGEGAGMPYLEAASCGVSSIYTNYAAAPEYAGSTGVPVNTEDYVILNSPGTRYYLPSVDGIAEALRKVYDADRAKLAVKARQFALKNSWENIIKDYWSPFLRDCESELYPRISKDGVGTWA